MGLEIERKFLVCDRQFEQLAVGVRYMMQFYLSADPERTVRVRATDENGYVTVKGITRGFERNEWEYVIPRADALEMAHLRVGRVVEKTRYIVPAGNGLNWEVDVFVGELAGLTVAEIELPSPDTVFELPPFIGREVTGDPAYYNSSLALSSSVPSAV